MNEIRHTIDFMNPSKTIARCLQELVLNDSIDNAFEKIVEWLPRSLEVNTCFIFKNHPGETNKTLTSLTYWWRTGLTNKSTLDLSFFENRDTALYPEIFETLCQKEIFIISIYSPAPPHLEELLINAHLQTFILVPIFVQDEVWGFIGLGHNAVKSWETSTITIMQSLAAAIGNQIFTGNVIKQLEDRTSIYQETLVSLNELIWEFDLQSKRLKVLGNSKDLGISGNIESTFNVLQAIQDYVYPLDRGRLIRSYVSILQSENKTTVEEKFRISSNSKEDYKWVKASLVLLPDTEGKTLVVTGTLTDVTDITNEISQSETQKQEHNFIIDKITQVVFSIDSTERWTSLSNTWEEMTGYIPEDCIGRSFYDFFAVEYISKLKKGYNSLLKEDENEIDLTVKLIHQSGKHFWVRLLARAIRNENGITGIFGLIDNVNEKHVYEQSIMEKEKRFRFITENISDCISILHKQGDFIYLSPSSRNVLGYVPNELLNQSVLSFIHPGHKEDFIKNILEAEALDDKFKPFRYQFQTSGNEYSWLETYARPVVNSRGDINAILCSTRNINERVRLMKEMESALSQQKEINEQHTKQATEASLQTKTSLMSLQSHLDIVKMYSAVLSDDEKFLFNQQFSKMRLEIARIQQIMSDMLISKKEEACSISSINEINKMYHQL